MNLTLNRFGRGGAVSVVGGRLLEVVTEHPVSLATLPKGDPRLRGEEDFATSAATHAFAKPGDLAVEVFYRKTGKLLGYSYLTGEAIQARRDAPADNDTLFFPLNFKPIEGRLITLPRDRSYPATNDPEQIKAVEKSKKLFMEEVIAQMAQAKFGSARIAAFHYRPLAAPVEAVVEQLTRVWQSITASATADGKQPIKAGPVNLMGLVSGRSAKNGRQATMLLNIQPKGQEHEYPVTPFQVDLVVNALEREKKRNAA